MSFSTFAILCFIALFAYYGYITFRQEKKEYSIDKKDAFKATNIVIEPPVSVTLDMVSFTPTIATENVSNSEDIILGDVDTSFNKYERTTTISGSLLDHLELASFVTKEAIDEGKLLFSNILL